MKSNVTVILLLHILNHCIGMVALASFLFDELQDHSGAFLLLADVIWLL